MGTLLLHNSIVYLQLLLAMLMTDRKVSGIAFYWPTNALNCIKLKG